MENNKISLSVPSIRGNEWRYIKECLDSEWVSSAGKYVDLFEKKISDFTKSKFSVACINGTSALQICIKIIGVKNNDEVIVPTITFIAPINAVRYNGGEPIFIDSDDSYGLDIKKTLEFIENETVFKDGYSYNKKTGRKIKAIIPVHLFGSAVLLDKLIIFCKKRNIKIIEDASEGLGTFFNSGNFANKHVGTIGDLGCLSFNGNKIITSGGGGMILTNEKKLADEANYLTKQAKDNPLEYKHNNIGYNFRLTNIQAALGVAQLEQLEFFIKQKKEIHKQYLDGFNNIEGISLLPQPNYVRSNYWLNVIIINNEKYKHSRNQLIDILRDNNIESRPVWYPNHLQKPYINNQNYKITKANNLVLNSLCLPSHNGLEKKDIDRVIKIIQK